MMLMTEKDKTTLGLKPDRDVDVPPKKLPEDSRTSKLLALQPGECYSESVRLSVGEQDWDKIKDAKVSIQSWQPKVVERARARHPGKAFCTTVGEFRDRNGAIYVTGVITRTE
jgi:hypothetical protein